MEKSQTVSSVTVNVDALLKQTKTGIYEILADVQAGSYGCTGCQRRDFDSTEPLVG